MPEYLASVTWRPDEPPRLVRRQRDLVAPGLLGGVERSFRADYEHQQAGIAGLDFCDAEFASSRSPEWHRRFGSRRLAETTLQLLDLMPRTDETDERPRYAILRWLNRRGGGDVLVFGPSEAVKLTRGMEIPDLLELDSGQHFFQVRIVRRRALIDVAMALKS